MTVKRNLIKNRESIEKYKVEPQKVMINFVKNGHKDSGKEITIEFDLDLVKSAKPEVNIQVQRAELSIEKAKQSIEGNKNMGGDHF